MAAPTLRSRLTKGDKIFAGWMASGYPRMAEALGRAGFDAVIIDLQHGESSFAEARDAIAARRFGVRPGRRAGRAGRLWRSGAALRCRRAIRHPADDQQCRRRAQARRYLEISTG